MSKKHPAPTAVENGVKARVLVDGAFGKVNDIVELDAETIAAAGSDLDPHPDAVAYAESLKVA